MNTFNSEKEFETALIAVIKNKGWEQDLIQYPSEEDLLNNWAEISNSKFKR